ncbi:MAG: TetR/AcrR family transcriptional regulator [Spirochaetaceae bacterium]|nr:TetR/AcrR family transcriptional regulator [Spirochaetaceae bacterium]
MLVSEKPAETAKERIMDAAERLFMAKGYAAVTLRDVGAGLGLSHAALYYHFPGGKEALFLEVTERNIRRHGAGLDEAIRANGPNLRSRLRAVADWLLSQAPMDLMRMVQSDLAAFPTAEARRVMNLVNELVIQRLRRLIEEAVAAGDIGPCDPALVGGGILGMVESLNSIPDFALRRSRAEMAYELLDIILRGLDFKEGANA